MHTDTFSQMRKSFFDERFGEDICQLVICVIVRDVNLTFGDMISNEVMLNLNMLGPRVLNWILSDVYSTCFVVEKRKDVLMDVVVFQLMLDPEKLSAT